MDHFFCSPDGVFLILEINLLQQVYLEGRNLLITYFICIEKIYKLQMSNLVKYVDDSVTLMSNQVEVIDY